MPDFLSEHSGKLIPLALLAVAAWFVLRAATKGRVQHGSKMPLKVYCNHCNWEGTVTRATMSCGRCGSTNLSVLAV